MFATHHGDTVLPVASDAAFGPVYWVASSRSSAAYYVKLANYGNATETVAVKFADVTMSASAELTLLSAGQMVSNYPGMVSVSPTTSNVTGSAAAGYSFEIPAWGVAVLAAEVADMTM